MLQDIEKHIMNSESDKEEIVWLNGLYVGMLSDEEMELLDRCIKAGIAERSYQGPSGMLGLAKVRVL